MTPDRFIQIHDQEIIIQMKSSFKNISEKHLRIVFAILMITVAVFFQIQRLRYIPITWDEGLTYVIHVKRFFHSGDFWKGIIRYFTDWTEDAGNNHVLNTLLIGLVEKITGTYFNDMVLRVPVCLFFVGYLFFSTREFLAERITWAGYSALMCCSYFNEFFAYSRGYSIAATLILISAIFYRKWQEEKKPYLAVVTFYILFLAETANTAVLLITAGFVVFFILEIIVEKEFFTVLKRLWFPILLYAVLQVLMIIHHFHVTGWDLCLYADTEHGVRRMMYSTLTLPAGSDITAKIFLGLILVLLLLNALLFLIRIRSFKPYSFCTILFIYFVICFTAVNVLDQGGYPMGRVLILSYPLVALGLDELVRAPESTHIKILKKGTFYVLQGLITVFLLFMLISSTDYRYSTDWPEAAEYKAAAYEAYEKGIEDEGYFSYIEPNTDAVRYWREKILYEHGHDIFGRE